MPKFCRSCGHTEMNHKNGECWALPPDRFCLCKKYEYTNPKPELIYINFKCLCGVVREIEADIGHDNFMYMKCICGSSAHWNIENRVMRFSHFVIPDVFKT